MTTQEDIRCWLNEGKAQNATHMLVVCDTYDYEDYPVFVQSHENVAEKANKYRGQNMQRIMECYDLNMDFETQLKERRSWNGWSPAQG